MTTKKMCEKECPVTGSGCDCISKVLCKVGVCRSTLITLALLPFAWDGVLWGAEVVRFLWDAATSAVS